MGAKLLILMLMSHRVKLFMIKPGELANRKIKMIAARIIDMVLEMKMVEFERHLGRCMLLRTWNNETQK